MENGHRTLTGSFGLAFSNHATVPTPTFDFSLRGVKIRQIHRVVSVKAKIVGVATFRVVHSTKMKELDSVPDFYGQKKRAAFQAAKRTETLHFVVPQRNERDETRIAKPNPPHLLSISA